MKKLIIVLAFFVVGFSAFAGDFSLGIRAGMPYNTIQAANAQVFPTSGYIWGGNLSAVLGLKIAGMWGLQIEAGYSCRSGFEAPLAGQKTVFSIPAIEVPVLLKVSLPFGFGIQAGPMITFLVGDAVTTVGGVKTRQSVTTGNYNTMLWGLAAGIDWALALGKHHRIVIDARFSMDFTNIGGPLSLKNRFAFTPSLGYQYKF